MKEWYENTPGLYDDIYMDLSFLDVIDKKGIDASAEDFANSFANAEYPLWHANQAARYNILNGIKPPQSGHWKNNPHCDDIDFQIEADFAGLITPGMPNSASQICDKVGHIMNYGDGWYGGVYFAAMYSLAFTANDINYVVKEALKTIPDSSNYYKAMSDIIKWHEQYPNDWKATWFEVTKKYNDDLHCPQGIYDQFNIDAIINSAYTVIGLLYGNGDFDKTIDIATRCGQDSDCNPASAGGILGAMIGYNKIPKKWMASLKQVEDMDFKYTTLSLNETYKMNEKIAYDMITKNGGKIDGNNVTIKYQEPKKVALEIAFDNQYFPQEKREIKFRFKKDSARVIDTYETEFEGIGVVLLGDTWRSKSIPETEKYVLEFDIYLDEKLIETTKMPTSFTTRKHEIFWKFDLKKGKHKLKIVWKNPAENVGLNVNSIVNFDDKMASKFINY